VVFCLSLTVTKAMREALETLTESGLEVRWYCAERDTFRPKGKRKTRTSQEKSFEKILAGSLVPAAQLRPDMHLEEALASY
jgi:hypothetical protein